MSGATRRRHVVEKAVASVWTILDSVGKMAPVAFFILAGAVWWANKNDQQEATNQRDSSMQSSISVLQSNVQDIGTKVQILSDEQQNNATQTQAIEAHFAKVENDLSGVRDDDQQLKAQMQIMISQWNPAAGVSK
jgi:septal ring factor EnvC (AmiA/AmiB activator)